MRKKDKLASLYVDTQYQMHDLEKKEIVSLLSIEEMKIESCHVMKSILNISSEMIFMFKTTPEYVPLLKDSIDMYLDGIQTKYDENEKKYIFDRRIYEKDGYYVVVISKKADNIIKEIKGELE